MARSVHIDIHGGDPQTPVVICGGLIGKTVRQRGEAPHRPIQTGDGNGIDGAFVQRRRSAPSEDAPVVRMAGVDVALTERHRFGATVPRPKKPVPGMDRVARMRDPDGNVFGVFEPDAEAK